MSLLAESLAGAKYMLVTNDDRESSTNGAAEFLRRKRWPEILLKELVGSAVFCLKPTLSFGSGQYQNGEAWSWKMIYSSPSVYEMLGRRPADLEGKDFFDLVLVDDRPQLQTFFNSLLAPPLLNVEPTLLSPQGPVTLGGSQTTYVRMLFAAPGSSRSDSDSGSYTRQRSLSQSNYGTPVRPLLGPVVWEIRAHATGVGEDLNEAGRSGETARMTTDGPVVPGIREGDDKHKAIWIMARQVGEAMNEDQKSLEAFMDVKLENERLLAELQELEEELGVRVEDSTNNNQSASTPSSRSSTDTPPGGDKNKNKVGRPAKTNTKPSTSGHKRQKSSTGGPIGGSEGETMYVCVTCGRTDSPEWRKGPLGPKTLCNACGLRWAKRNSTQIPKKDKQPP
ncbi:white collar 2 protein [Cryptococcus deuterogattii 99/473]|uniref:Cutinase palindrome-binding protein n=3 Tax=Cryptococcus gattii species complex TaxID=1884637 RepID=A0A0D0T1J5_9TREE|nr:cutinase palindrome-binding protein [Cryptococcus deuterogattii R265]KIR29520.1 cutinase palindrome-binding protein [Cryptococcus deuterogattii LA55]KIR39547.1 cutinase palindrome-binding protein [Cryptococcus deuterogattii Ram5]KIR73882.1 cutinase palindrome-binding protein [Cryptococcus deuterogattii CA1014]KIR93374.1 white collar 2 protein [Cryptococcus deuterogattii CBS 10090]KIR99363.1 cutinase palindrome-binding protein [Cryptococcus deuterogattii 2001/935-1]KIY59177.1 white collar 2